MARLSTDEVMKLVSSGERSAWRKIEMIRNQTRISRKLDEIVRDYEEQYLLKHNGSKQGKAARSAA